MQVSTELGQTLRAKTQREQSKLGQTRPAQKRQEQRLQVPMRPESTLCKSM